MRQILVFMREIFCCVCVSGEFKPECVCVCHVQCVRVGMSDVGIASLKCTCNYGYVKGLIAKFEVYLLKKKFN